MGKKVVVITGSRSITDREKIFNKLEELLNPREIYTFIEGEAAGVDLISRDWCEINYVHVTTMAIPSNYHVMYGKAAGNIRNQDMVNKALNIARSNGLDIQGIAFWDGASTGTQDMISRMRKSGIPMDITLMGIPKSKRLI